MLLGFYFVLIYLLFMVNLPKIKFKKINVCLYVKQQVKIVNFSQNWALRENSSKLKGSASQRGFGPKTLNAKL